MKTKLLVAIPACISMGKLFDSMVCSEPCLKLEHKYYYYACEKIYTQKIKRIVKIAKIEFTYSNISGITKNIFCDSVRKAEFFLKYITKRAGKIKKINSEINEGDVSFGVS